MPKQAPKTDRGHIAYDRTNQSGTVSHINAKAKKAKPKKPEKPKFSVGDEVYFKRPGGDLKTRRGTLVRKRRTGWVILGRPDGKTISVESRETFVPEQHILTAKEWEKKRQGSGRVTVTSASKRVVSVAESNKRAATAAKRFPLTEEKILLNPKFQTMMSRTVTSLAQKNGIRPGDWTRRGGMHFSEDNLEYNDLVSDYVTAAANALRKELAEAPKADLDAFLAHLEGTEDGSRIFVTATIAGRNAVMGALKERAKRLEELTDFQEVEQDAGLRRKLGMHMAADDATGEYGEEDGGWNGKGDENFQFEFDEDDDAHLFGTSYSYDPRGGDAYEQMRYREAMIDHFLDKLPEPEKDVVERKYGLGEHLEPQTSDEIAATMKRRKVAHPIEGKEWNRQTVKPVHDQALEHLRGMENIKKLKQFYRALKMHLTLMKAIGPHRILEPGVVLRKAHGHLFIDCLNDSLAKSYSADLAAKYPGGRWITVTEASSPLRGRHIFILPHKDGSATVLTGGGPAMRHKLLQPKKEEPAEKKPVAEGGDSKPSADSTEEQKKPAKPELSEERRQELESAKQSHKEEIKAEKQKLAEIVRQHLGTEVELTDKERDAIEKKIEGIADPQEKKLERLRETVKARKEKDAALKEIMDLAKKSVVNEEPTATEPPAEAGEDVVKHPTIAEVVKAHAEDLLNHHYKIKQLERENKELTKLLKTGNEKRQINDAIKFEPLSKDDLKKVIVDEDLRDKEMAAHYKLAATVRGYVDEKGHEHKAKGGEGVDRNLRTGGYEALTGMVGELTGNSIMTKTVYDEIGARNAAVLAHYYLKNSGISSKKLGEHLAEDLGRIGSEIATRAVRKGDDFMAAAEKVKSTGFGDDSLMEAAQARGAALKYINKAYETYAQAQGALNQAAELAYDAANDSGKIEIGAASTSTLEAKRRRIGLKANDVKVEKDGSGYKMTVKPEAFEKLIHEYATPKTGGIAGEGYTAEDIKAHRANTDDFHPAGLRDMTPPDKSGVQHVIKLSPSQQAAVRFIEKQKRVYLNYEAGTGKSLSVIAAKAHLEEQSGEQKKMIVSMPSPIMKNFAAEVKKFSGYNVAVIEPSDTPEQRRAKYNSGPDTIVICNHEKMNFDGADIAKAGFHMVVTDEAHTITQKEGGKKSFKSEGLRNVASQADHYIAMSGTPTPNNLSELYFHANLINPEKFGSQREFMARFGSAHKGEGMKQKIAAFMNKELADHVITAKKGTMLKPDGKPVELRMKAHYAKLSPGQRKEYKEAVAALKSGEISQLQLENRMKGILNNTHHAENGKFAHIKQIIDHHLATKGATEKVSLYVNSYEGADNILDFIEQHYPGMGVVRFANRDRKKAGESEGRNYSAKEKAGFIDTFKHDNSVRFGIHTMAGTTGLNVQHDGNGGGATTVVAVSSGEAGYATLDQFFSRAYRTGANRDVDAHMVLTDTPYDMGTKLRLDEKKAVGEMIKAAPGAFLLRKAHVKAHSRRTKSGAVAQVREHEDKRRAKVEAGRAEFWKQYPNKNITAVKNAKGGYDVVLRSSKTGKVLRVLEKNVDTNMIDIRNAVDNHYATYAPKSGEDQAKLEATFQSLLGDTGKKHRGQSQAPRKGERLADVLHRDLTSGALSKRQFLQDRKKTREALKAAKATIKEGVKTGNGAKVMQGRKAEGEHAERLSHYDEVYGKHNFLSEKQQKQLQWFRDRQTKVMPEHDHFLEAMAKLGGISADEAKHQWGLSIKEYPALNLPKIFANPLKAKGGISPDKMAEMLMEWGYVKADEHGKADWRDFEDKLLRAASGEEIMTDQRQADTDLSAEEERYYREKELPLPEMSDDEIDEFFATGTTYKSLRGFAATLIKAGKRQAAIELAFAIRKQETP